MTLRTPFCDLLGVEHPIVLAGMGGVARAELAAAVSNAGGLGFLGMVREKPELIRDQIAQVRSLTARPFGVNLIPAATPAALLEVEIQVVLQTKVPAVTLFWDLNAPLVARLKQAGMRVFCQVGTADEAAEAAHAGADVLIAQGVEAGGHVRGIVPLRTLLADIVARRLAPPVLAAGGLADGRDVADAMKRGAQGAVLGTAFLVTRESFANEFHKQRIVAAKPGETLRTEIFHINWPRGAAVRVLPNSVTRGERGDPWSGALQMIGHEDGRPIYLFSTDSPQRNMTGDFEAMALYAGAGAGRLTSIPGAAERLAAIVAEAARLLDEDDASGQGASPACAMDEAPAEYMGYASRDELVAALNELLEAERAGVRVASETAAAASGGRADLMRAVQRDEACWCDMLTRHITALGAAPSNAVGAFHGKAMAIADLDARTAFLNRGQGWVVRRLKEMLPRVRDDGLHAALSEMLRSHETNIAIAATQLPVPAKS